MLFTSWLRSLKFSSRLTGPARRHKRRSIPLFGIERLEDRTLLSTLVTHYDATTLGLADGALVNSWADITGNGNNLSVAVGFGATAGSFVANGIGGQGSVQFGLNGAGYLSALNMGTAFGIQGDSGWSMILVVRPTGDPASGQVHNGIIGMGDPFTPNGIVRIEPTNDGGGGGSRFDIAGGFSHDVVLDPQGSYTSQFLNQDLIFTLIHEANTGNSMLDTLELFINGDAPGQGALAGNSLGTTGNAATTAFNLIDLPVNVGNTDGNGFEGLLAEVLIFNDALTETERQSVEAQLSQKFDIEGSFAVLSGLSLLESTFFGGAGDQRGTDVEIQGSDIYVSVNTNESQSPSDSSALLKYSAPTGPSTTPVFSKSWTFGTLHGISALGNSVYGAGFSHPGNGLTNDGTGGTEVKTLLTNFDANNATGVGPGGSNWAAVVPKGTFNTSPGTSFFSYNGVENYIDAVAVDDGGSTFVYAVGHAQPCSHNTFVVGKYDSAGNVVAGATAASADFNTCSAPEDAKGAAFGVIELNGDIYVAGGIRDNFSGLSGRATVWKYNSDLVVQWKNQDLSIQGNFSGMATDGTSIYAVGAAGVDVDYFVAKYDQAGNQLWSTVSGGVGTTEVLHDVVAVGGRLFAVGYTNGSGAGGEDMVIIEIDPATGAVLATETFGGSQNDRASGVATDGTELYVVGESRSFAEGGNSVGQNDAVLLRYDIGVFEPAELHNVAPELTSLSVTPMIFENEFATLTGEIVDPGTLDTFTLDVGWGDPLSPNDTQSFNLGATALSQAADGIDWNPATRQFEIDHQYLDDNPTATASDDYTVEVTVRDDDGVATTAWDMLEPAGTLIPGRVGSGTAYDPNTNRLIVYAGAPNNPGCSSSCLLGDVWTLDNANGEDLAPPEWTQLSPSGTPPSNRWFHGTTYDAASNRMIVFGGSSTIGICSGTQNDTWVLDNANGSGSPAWTKLTPTGSLPADRRSMNVHYDDDTNRLIMQGGVTNCGSGPDDTWVLEDANGLGAPNWIPLSPTGTPPISADRVSAYDAANNRLIAWSNSSELSILENANGLGGTPQWTQLTYTGTAPFRFGAAVGYDAARNELLLFGGNDAGGRRNETFVLQHANGLDGTPNWIELSPDPDPAFGLPTERGTHEAFLDPATGNFIIFAGTQFNNGDNFNDTWVLRRASGEDTASLSVTVKNVTPELTSLSVTPMIFENEFATLTGEIVDPGTLDTFTLDVNWGDPLSPNNIEQFTFGASATGSQTFTLTHQYLDDNPTATPQDDYTISVMVADDDGGLAVTPASWSSLAPMPTARQAPGAAVIDGEIYVVGGSPIGVGAFLEIFDPLSGSWRTGPSAPTNRSEASVEAIGNRLYVVGGCVNSDCNNATNSLEAFDVTTNSWITGLAAMPTTRFGTASAVIDGKLYVVGGGLAGFTTASNKLEIYDPATNTWTTAANMPTARELPGAAVIDGKLYVVGGLERGGTGVHNTTNVVEVYDPATNSWSTAAVMPAGRWAFTAESAGGKLYVIGGNDLSPSHLDTVEVYDPATDTWSPTASMPTARALLTSVVIDGHIFVTGGLRNTSSPHANELEVFTPPTPVTTVTTTVKNVAPELTSLSVTPMIFENEFATLTGEIVDPGTLDTFTLDIGWGDPLSPNDTQSFALAGTALTKAADGIDWNPITRQFSVDHQYLDDNPSSTPQDNYTIEVTVTDDDAAGVAGPVTSGRVGYWPADGNANDFSGSGNHGTLQGGATFDTGIVGQAFSLNGVNGWISTNQTFANDQSHSIAAWVYWNGHNAQSFQEIVSWWNTSDPVPNRMFLGTANPTTSQGPIRYGDDWQNVPVNLPTGQWVHVAATYDGATNNREVFLNGISRATLPSSAEARFSGLLAIGRQGNTVTAGEYWDGKIDELALYDRVLSSTDIELLAGALTAGDSQTVTVTVKNVAPELANVSVTSMIDENGTAMLSGDVVDPGTLDTFTLDIGWGDPLSPNDTQSFNFGSTALTKAANGIDWNPATRQFAVDHQYLDDNPSGTSQDDYTIKVSLTDDDTPAVSDLLVVSHVTDEVLRYDGATGAFVGTFVSAGSGGLDGPVDIISGPDGNIYVSSALTDEVHRYDGATGAFIDIFVTAGSGGLDNPEGITFGPDGNLYVLGKITDNILRYDGSTGAFIDEFVTAGSGGLPNGNDIEFGLDGNLYVSGGSASGVHRYDGATGSFLDLFGPTGSRVLGALTFGPDGNLYAASPFDNTILRSNGTTQGTFSVFASGLPTAYLLFGNDGDFYVSGGGTSNVNRLDGATGALIDEFVTAGSGGLANSQAMLFVSNAAIQTVTTTVKNVAPELTSLSVTPVIPENEFATLTGEIVDPGTLDTFTLDVNWGDPLSPNNIEQFTFGASATGSQTFTLTHQYLDDNPTATPSDNYTINLTLTDDDSGTDTASTSVTANNVAPEIVSISLSSTSIDEADSVTVSGTYADPALGAPTETFDGSALWSDGVSTPLTIVGGTFSTSRTFLDDDPTGTPSDTFTVDITINDDDLGSDTETSPVLTVNNVAPTNVVINSVVDGYVLAVGEILPFFSDTFTDVGTLDTHTALWNFQYVVDTTTVTETRPGTVIQASGSGNVADNFSFSAPGVYTATLTVTDDDSGVTTSAERVFVVYDPSAGFVTGRGRINSPAGAYLPDPGLSGIADFAFVSKYQPGTTTPTGQTQFRFRAADLDFRSRVYDWLVIAGARAQFKGNGTINGAGGFDFMITAIDGRVNGGGEDDKIRVKIWDRLEGGVVYDNGLGNPDDDEPPTAILSGQIIVQTGGNALHASSVSAGNGIASDFLTHSMLDPVVNQARSLFGSTDLDAGILNKVDVQIANLPGSLLGMASSSTNILWIDRDAAGYGWSMGVESRGSRIEGSGVDLLSVVSHELGHMLGFNHDVMGATLNPGVRQLASSSFSTGFDANDGFGSLHNLGLIGGFDTFSPGSFTTYTTHQDDSIWTTTIFDQPFETLLILFDHERPFRIAGAEDDESDLTAKEVGLLFRRSSEAEEFDHLFAEFQESLAEAI